MILAIVHALTSLAFGEHVENPEGIVMRCTNFEDAVQAGLQNLHSLAGFQAAYPAGTIPAIGRFSGLEG